MPRVIQKFRFSVNSPRIDMINVNKNAPSTFKKKAFNCKFPFIIVDLLQHQFLIFIFIQII